MANPVVVDFIVKGLPDIQRAMRTVTAAAEAAERSATRAASQGEKARVRSADAEARAKVRAWTKTEAEMKRIVDRAYKDTERQASRKQTADKRAADAAIREAERESREKIRIYDRAEREVERIGERARARAKQNFDRQEKAAARSAAQQANEQAAARRHIAGTLAGGVMRGVSAGAGRVAGLTRQTAEMTAQLGGGFSIADSVMGEKGLRVQAARLSASTILSRAGADKAMGRAYTTNEVLAHAKSVGLQQAIEPSDIMKGYDEIKKLTGNMEKAVQFMPAVAKLATATGGDVAQMSGLAGNILAADPNIKQADMEKQLRIFARQGVVGGVEIGDFAKYGSRLTAGAVNFGGNKEANEVVLGALAQTSRQYGGANNAAEATLAAQRFSTDVAKNASKLKSSGIDVSDKHGNLKDAESIIMDMLDKTKGDVTKLSKMGLGERGVKVLTGAAALYKDAGGGESGKKAVHEELAKYQSETTQAEIDEASKRVLAEQGADRAMMQLRITVGEKLLPELVKLVPTIAEATPAFAELLRTGLPAFVELAKTAIEFGVAHKDLIRTLANHPIGTIITYEITKSLAAAGIGEAVKFALLKLLPGAVPGTAATPGVPGIGPGVAVLAGVAAQTAGFYDLYNTVSGNDAKGQIEEIKKRAAGGDVSGAQDMVKQADGKTGTMDAINAYASVVNKATALYNPATAVGSYVGGKASDALGVNDQMKNYFNAKEIVDSASIKKAIADAVAEGAKQGVSGPGSPDNPAPQRGKSMTERN